MAAPLRQWPSLCSSLSFACPLMGCSYCTASYCHQTKVVSGLRHAYFALTSDLEGHSMHNCQRMCTVVSSWVINCLFFFFFVSSVVLVKVAYTRTWTLFAYSV